MRSAAAKFEDWIPSLKSPPQVDPKDPKDPKPYKSHPPQPPGAVSDTEGEPVCQRVLVVCTAEQDNKKTNTAQ